MRLPDGDLIPGREVCRGCDGTGYDKAMGARGATWKCMVCGGEGSVPERLAKFWWGAR